MDADSYLYEFEVPQEPTIDPRVEKLSQQLLAWDKARFMLNGIDVVNMLIDAKLLEPSQASKLIENFKIYSEPPKLPTRHFSEQGQ